MEDQETNQKQDDGCGYPVAGDVVFEKYRILSELGAGSFGVVYKTEHVDTKERAALKVANKNAPPALMATECRLYRLLDGSVGMAQLHQCGMVRNRPAMLMEQLGPSLQELFVVCGCRFSLPTVLQLALQMIDRIARFHQINYVHRDIKPDNFVIGRGSRKNLVHLIDFGLAKPFWNNRQQRHRSRGGNNSLVGTMRFASQNAHLGYELSRRDDMESLGYTLVYFLKGSLPWQGLKGCTRTQKCELIKEVKLSVSLGTLCAGLPPEFGRYLVYCRQLRYNDEPDYHVVRGLFDLLYRQQCVPRRPTFDWTPRRAITKRNRLARMPEQPDNPDEYSLQMAYLRNVLTQDYDWLSPL